MPGIAGYIGSYDEASGSKLIGNMIRSLKNEGWYKVDSYTEPSFGFARVSLGFSNPEAQPLWNDDKSLCIVFEGELYDYQGLKDILASQGHRFQTNNDVEFALRLYQEFGEQFVSHLNGSFILAIWDYRAKRVLIANDRFGLHPLYFAQAIQNLLFASGARAILAASSTFNKVDSTTILQLLAFEHAIGDSTLIEAIKLLPPASILTFREGSLSIQTYWYLEYSKSYQPLSENEFLEQLIHYLRQAISRQAIYDDRVSGILLSGGLDSRVILALLASSTARRPLHSFTFGIPGCDDARFAKEVADQVGTKHEFMELSPGFLLEIAEEGVRLTDGLKSCIHMHAFANLREQSRHVQVIYKGYMGDPLMGSHIKRQFLADYDEETLVRFTFNNYNNLFHITELPELLTDAFCGQAREDIYDNFRANLAQSKSPLIADWEDKFDFRQRQRRFILNGVELVRSQVIVRTPFCDNDLVDFMLTVPPGVRFERYLYIKAFIQMTPRLAKIPWTDTNRPLIACARDLFIRTDEQIRWRLRGAGMVWVPVRQQRPYSDYNLWLRTALRNWVEETLLSKRALERGYFNPNFIRTLVTEHMGGANHARKLGVLLSIELWHRQFMD